MKITFIIANELYESETQNRCRRSVTIELTPEQEKLLNLSCVGECKAKVWYESITDCFVESGVD